MAFSPYRNMRIILMFDLPTITDDDKKEYTNFRKSILKLGYTMIQYSIYVKCINTQSKFEQEYQKIKKTIPTSGNIRMFQITEQQYSNIKIILGNKKINEIYNDERRYVKI